MFKVQWYVNLDEYHHLIQFILASKTYTVFSMLLSCTIYCTFHCALLRCSFHVLLSLLLITLESKRCQSNDSTLLFIKDLPSVSQSNVQAVTAETEVQYTLSNIIYFKFQNCCFFSFRSILKEVLLRCTQTK